MLHFRQSMGLSTDDAQLADAELATNRSEELFGVPLTDAEYQELTFRQTVIEDDAALARSTVTALLGPDGLAGVWMDNRGGGQFTVAVTERLPDAKRVLSEALHHPHRLDVVQMEWSYERLESLASRVLERAQVDGVRVSSVQIDERGNAVRVLSSDNPEQIRQWLASWLTDAPIVVEKGTAAFVGTPYTNSPPFRGGQAINSSTGYTCTSTFVARGSGRHFLLTSGHCSSTGVSWDQSGVLVGHTDRTDISGSDSQRITMESAYRSNEVVLWYSPWLATEARYRTITCSQDSTDDSVGQVSCITGQNFSDLRCGEILTRSYSISKRSHDGRLVTYTNGREIDALCEPGDSGGPALRASQARGIISLQSIKGDGSSTCVYVHISEALNGLGLANVVTSPAGPIDIIDV